MTQWLTQLTEKGRVLLMAALGVVVVYGILTTYLKTRALVPTLLVAFTGGVAVWLANHYTWISTKVDEETTGAAAVVVRGGVVAARVATARLVGWS